MHKVLLTCYRSVQSLLLKLQSRFTVDVLIMHELALHNSSSASDLRSNQVGEAIKPQLFAWRITPKVFWGMMHYEINISVWGSCYLSSGNSKNHRHFEMSSQHLTTTVPMPAEPVSQPKCKPRAEHAPYKPHKPRVDVNKNSPRSLAQVQSHKKSRCNLTLHDWLTVFAYVDAHPGVSQDVIVRHFKTWSDGALIFDQSTLSRKLAKCKTLQARVHEFPNALLMKRPRIVTQPDVECALFLWVKHMEEK